MLKFWEIKKLGMGGKKSHANYQNNSSRKSKCKPVFDLFYQLIKNVQFCIIIWCKLDGNEIKYSFSYLGNLPGGLFSLQSGSKCCPYGNYVQ